MCMHLSLKRSVNFLLFNMHVEVNDRFLTWQTNRNLVYSDEASFIDSFHHCFFVAIKMTDDEMIVTAGNNYFGY